MRITTLMAPEQVQQNLNNQVSSILQDETEISTGNALTEPSTNPAAFAQDLALTQSLSQTQNLENVASSALSVAQGTDQALTQIGQVASTAYTDGLSAGGAVGGEGMNAIAQEVSSLMKTVGQMANSQVGNVYVLGGQSTTAPWTSGTAVTSSSAMTVQVGTNLSVQQNVNGGPLVSPVLSAMQNLSTSLQTLSHSGPFTVAVTATYGSGSSATTYSGTTGTYLPSSPTTLTATLAGAPSGTPTSWTATVQEGQTTIGSLSLPVSDVGAGGEVSITMPTIDSSLAQLQTAENGLTTAQASFGTNMQRLQAGQSMLTSNATSLTTSQAQVQDASIPAVVSDLSTQETVYQAILQTSSSVMLPTLASYLNQVG